MPLKNFRIVLLKAQWTNWYKFIWEQRQIQDPPLSVRHFLRNTESLLKTSFELRLFRLELQRNARLGPSSSCTSVENQAAHQAKRKNHDNRFSPSVVNDNPNGSEASLSALGLISGVVFFFLAFGTKAWHAGLVNPTYLCIFFRLENNNLIYLQLWKIR